MSKRILTRVREAIFNEFGEFIPGDTKREKMAEIRKATRTGANDPGGWSPDAAVIIWTETGIPNPAFDMSEGFQIIEGWFRISAVLGTHWVEPINAAVMAVYENYPDPRLSKGETE